MKDPKSQFWKNVQSAGVNLYDPDALAGLGPFTLPAGHWLTNAARPHDGGYEAKERGELPPEAKGRIDVVFFRTAAIDSNAKLTRDLANLPFYNPPAEDKLGISPEEWAAWNREAERLTDLCFAYLAIRSPIGDLAWNT